MFGEKKKNNALVFLITGIFFLALVVTYKVVFYSRYLDLNTNSVIFEWTGGEQEVLVYTNANCWVVEDEEYVNWASFQKKGNSLQITVYQNNDKTERSSYIKIRSGLIEGIGNKWTSLKVIQDGKQATYINSSARSVSFSEQGGSESLQINTDGDGWIVVDCPNWVSKKVSGNTLVLSAFDNNSTPRNGIIRVQSDERMIEIEVFQQGSLVYTVHGVSFTMKSVEGGTFIMGNNNSEWDDEKPSHEVMVNSFYMGETEVTIALWKAVMGGKIPSLINRDFFINCNKELPVEVDWSECQEFIQKLNHITGAVFRLPTEAEWEFAAKGGRRSKGYKYSGSNNMNDVAWFTYGGENIVKQKQPNELGFYDMSGNALEWCSDWYGPYNGSPQINPKGPSRGSARVLRGGTGVMESGPEDCQVTNRCAGSPAGIRLCLQYKEAPYMK